MANPLKKSDRTRNREEPKLGEPKLVKTDEMTEPAVVHEFQGERVADTLIRARQQVGQDLRSIAEVLCIRYSYLDAIERGQYENLPGATYAVGFVRTYAEYLGLDGVSVVERFKSEVEGLDSQTKLHFPTPAPEGKMPGGAVFLVAALLFAGAYGVWFYLSNNGETLSDLVAPVPERLQEMVDGDSPAATADSAAPATPAPAPAHVVEAAPAESMPAAADTPATEAPAAMAENPPSAPSAPTGTSPQTDLSTAATAVSEAPEVPTAPAAANPAAAAAAPSAAVMPQAAATASEVPTATANDTAAAAVTPPQSEAPGAEAPAVSAPGAGESLAIPAAPDGAAPATAFLVNHEPQVYGEENADARIVLKANQDAWVQVRDRQGTLLLTRVLRVGDTYRVPNQQDLTLLTGNAGGLEISVDGRALAPLGPVGAVRRNIPLDPQVLVSGEGR